MASRRIKKIELNHKPDETIRLAPALVDRELKKSTESPVEHSLASVIFCFSFLGGVFAAERWSRRLFYVAIASGSTTPLRISFTSASSGSVPNACPCCPASRDAMNASAIAGEL
jgi:hypothetical protein